MNIENLQQAIPIVSMAIKKNTDENVHEIRLANEGRHLFVTTDKNKYWVLFKRDFFHSFGKIFNLQGKGESINYDMFELARSNGVTFFIFCYPNGNAYAIRLETIMEYVREFNTIRTTENGEKTYSFSVGLLSRWY